MSIVIHRPAAARGDGILRILVQHLDRLMQSMADARERRRLRRASLALAMVDERTLKDIGLERCQVQHAMRSDPRQADRFLKYY